MKINIVTGKPADGGPARCLMISESADPVLDFYTTLRGNEGVLTAEDGTEEKFTQIALFQRPTTSKRSRFQHDETPAGAEPLTPAVKKPAAKEKKKPDPAKAGGTGDDANDTGI